MRWTSEQIGTQYTEGCRIAHECNESMYSLFVIDTSEYPRLPFSGKLLATPPQETTILREGRDFLSRSLDMIDRFIDEADERFTRAFAMHFESYPWRASTFYARNQQVIGRLRGHHALVRNAVQQGRLPVLDADTQQVYLNLTQILDAMRPQTMHTYGNS